MPELTGFQKALLFALAASWIIAAFRVARMARYYGRSPLKWLCITLLFSALPATIVFWADQRKRIVAVETPHQPKPDAPMRCPHCGAVIDRPDDTTSPDECPHCRVVIDRNFLA